MNKLLNILFVLVITLSFCAYAGLGLSLNIAWYYGDLSKQAIVHLVAFWVVTALAAGLYIGYRYTKKNAEDTYKAFGRPILG